MKQIPIYLVLFVLLMASCAKDDVAVPSDGTEAAVHFSLSTAPMLDSNPSTRSTDSLTVDDSSIDNIWIFQFTTAGVFQRKLYLKPTDWSDFEVNLIAKGASHLYFVANVGPNGFAADYAPANVSSLAAVVETESMCLYSGSGKKLIPMRGRLLNITPAKDLLQSKRVVMYRLMARIDYTYSVDPTFAANKGFNVTKIRLRNVNANALIDSVSPTNNNYPDTLTLRTQNFSYEAGIDNTSRTLTFYVPANQRGFGANTALLDPRDKTGKLGATYIEMVGTTTAGDEYTFSLYPGADEYNDYNIRANTRYRLSANLVGLSKNDGRIKKTVVETATSNCYIVAPNGTVSIPVSHANKSALGTQLPDVTSGWSASIYWQTAAGLITVSEADKSNGNFTVTAGAATGNAVVAVKDGSGNILWSWHIWVTDYNPATENETMNDNVWMSRNLGATAVADTMAQTTFATSGGLLYQWGRKDPFPGSDGINLTSPFTALPIYDATGTLMTNTSLTWPTETTTATGSTGDVVKMATLGTTAGTQIPFASQLAYSVKYPLLQLVNWAGSTARASAAHSTVGGMNSWGGEYGEGKSVYDPCPLGWRVPSGRKASNVYVSPWSSWVTTQTFTTSAFAALKWNAAGSFGTYFYPAAGGRGSSGALYFIVGAFGGYWGASPNGTGGYNLLFRSGTVNPNDFTNRSADFGVRCVQE